MIDRDIQKIEAVKKILVKKFTETGRESEFFYFNELAKDPLLADRMGVIRIFEIIQDASDKNISFEIFKEQHRLPDTAAYGPGKMSDPYPAGIGVHISDPKKLNEFFESILQYPIRLSEHKVQFDNKKGIVTVNGRNVVLPIDKNEHALCTVMFDTNNPVGIPVDWTVVYDGITEVDPISTNASKKKMDAWTRSIRDTMNAVNERVQKDLNTKDELFSWTEKSVKRNF